ncbi:MAG: hypothetical protein ACOCRX_01375 [Candidatus Woesearchaeota archaeon]
MKKGLEKTEERFSHLLVETFGSITGMIKFVLVTILLSIILYAFYFLIIAESVYNATGYVIGIKPFVLIVGIGRLIVEYKARQLYNYFEEKNTIKESE